MTVSAYPMEKTLNTKEILYKLVFNQRSSFPSIFSITLDSVGSRFIVSDASTSTLRCYSSANGNFLWEKPQKSVDPKKGRKQKDQPSSPLVLPASLAVDQKQNM